MSNKNRLTSVKAVRLYCAAFPHNKDFETITEPTNSGHMIVVLDGNGRQVDRVLVRYDLTIFRNYKQVFPEVQL